MKIASLIGAGIVLACGCVHTVEPVDVRPIPERPQDVFKPVAEPPAPSVVPDRPASEHGLVMGKTMHFVFGLPGAFEGKPGKPVPPRPVSGVGVSFKSKSGADYTVASGEDGIYSIALPPGKYTIKFGYWNTEVIVVEAGKTYEKDLCVGSVFVD